MRSQREKTLIRDNYVHKKKLSFLECFDRLIKGFILWVCGGQHSTASLLYAKRDAGTCPLRAKEDTLFSNS